MGEEVDDYYCVAGLSWGPGLVMKPPYTCVLSLLLLLYLYNGRLCGKKGWGGSV